MAVTFVEVKQFWDNLFSFMGLAEMASKAYMAHENIRETFIKLRNVWADNEQNLNVALEMIQILSAMSHMTFTAQMSGEDQISTLTCWFEKGECTTTVHPIAMTSIRCKIACWTNTVSKRQMLEGELAAALDELTSLEDLASGAKCTKLQQTFQAAHALLEDVFWVLRSMPV